SRTIPSLRRAPHPRPLYPPPTRRSSDLTATATQRPDQGDQSTAVTKGPAIAPALFFCQSVRLPWRQCTRFAIRKSNIYLIGPMRSEEHTSELQSRANHVGSLLPQNKNVQ